MSHSASHRKQRVDGVKVAKAFELGLLPAQGASIHSLVIQAWFKPGLVQQFRDSP
jgi:hypothetical protein